MMRRISAGQALTELRALEVGVEAREFVEVLEGNPETTVSCSGPVTVGTILPRWRIRAQSSRLPGTQEFVSALERADLETELYAFTVEADGCFHHLRVGSDGTVIGYIADAPRVSG